MEPKSRWTGRLRSKFAVCIFLFLAMPAAAQTVPACEDSTQLKIVFNELRSLRVELLEFKLDQAQNRIAEIQKLLRDAENERNQLSNQQRSQIQELADVEELLSQPSLTMEARSELQTYRTELTSRGFARLAERASSVASREAELRALLSHQERLLQQLAASLDALAGARAPH